MLKILVASLLLCSSAMAAQPAIQYVGAVSINPSQDAKVLADWYQKFGIELLLYRGVYFGSFDTAAGPFAFAIHPKKPDASRASSASVSVVFRVNDYAGYVAKLEKQGLIPEPEPVEDDDETGHFAHYRDPDGNEMTVWGD